MFANLAQPLRLIVLSLFMAFMLCWLWPALSAQQAATIASTNSDSQDAPQATTAAGGLDTSFDPGTGLDGPVDEFALQSDGKIVIAGQFSTYNGMSRSDIARLNSDGGLDTSFNPGTGSNCSAFTTALQSDGKIIIGGCFSAYNGVGRNGIARLNSDGSLDTSFNPGTGAITLYTVAIQNDGKIVIGGTFASYNGVGRNRIARVNSDGSLDTSFNPGTGANDDVLDIVQQSDGKIIIGGHFTTYNGVGRSRIARLNSDGSLDTSFNPGTGADAVVAALALQSDGKVMVGGRFTNYNGVGRNGIVRVNADGSLDPSFNPGTGTGAPSRFVYDLKVQSDGKVIIGGNFLSYNGVGRNGVARLNSDGSLDPSFHPGTGALGDVWTLAVQSDGKILISGLFAVYNGVGRNRIARILSDQVSDTLFIDPKASYLRRSQDPNATNSLVINLQAQGFAPGDLIKLENLGAFSFCDTCADNGVAMSGVFSSSNTILGSDQLSRVPGAIAVPGAPAFVTSPTLFDNLPTDIPQDFRIHPEVTVTIPAGAQFLIIAVPDSYNGDNTDPNGDLAVRVTMSSCTFSLNRSSATFLAPGGGGGVNVIAPAGCSWTATSNASWITINNGSGSGNGTASFTVAANTTGQTRTGTLTIAGQTFTVTQTTATILPPVPGSDGRIVFTSARTGNFEVYVMDADGSNVVQLTNNPAQDFTPSWSPDGARIAFGSRRDGNAEIYVMNADGTNVTRLTNNSGDDDTPRFSPNGTRIGFIRGGNIHSMNADGTNQTQITSGLGFIYNFSWSPDGTKVAFASDHQGNYEIYTMNTDGTNLTRLTNNPAYEDNPAWSPDGTRISFTDNEFGTTGGIYVINADGTNKQRLTNGGGVGAVDDFSHWSQDSTRLAFMSDRDGNFEVYVMNADGTGQTNLTYNFASDTRPNWEQKPVVQAADDFSGPVRNAALWDLGSLTEASDTAPDSLAPNAPAVVIVAQLNGRLEITPRANAAGKNFGGYKSALSADLRNGNARIEVVQATNGGTALTIFGVGRDLQNWYRFAVADSSAGNSPDGFGVRGQRSAPEALVLLLQFSVNGVRSTISIPYDPAQHRFWRLRHDAANNQIVFETSPNGATWTVQRTVPVQGSVSDLRVDISAGTGAAMNDPGRAIFDKFLVSPNGGNLVDNAQFFVRQQYRDFLNREPDAGGLEYWTSQITQCGTNPTCIHVRRVGVSAAYFIELEFQRTGAFVYRAHKAALGTGLGYLPSFAQFVPDRALVVEGTDVEASKLNFTTIFVQRGEFTTRYPLAQTRDQFIDALLANIQQGSGVNLGSIRPALVGEYDAGSSQTNSRARVLRAVANDATLTQAEFNRAFVLMQYFGYLQRDPDQGGYDFWLDVVNNRVTNNYLAMVCAFVTSAEYQQRFGSAVTRQNSDCAVVQ